MSKISYKNLITLLPKYMKEENDGWQSLNSVLDFHYFTVDKGQVMEYMKNLYQEQC